MSVKGEMIRITKRLHELYPGKHIRIGVNSRYYDHAGGRFDWRYDLYVEDVFNKDDFISPASMDAWITDKHASHF